MSTKQKDLYHLDSAESVYFEGELRHIKAQTYDVVRKDLKATLLIPVNTDVNPGAEFIEYRSYDQVGMAKIVADYAKDFPRVDVYGTAKSVKIKSIGDAYGYTIQEIRRAAMQPNAKLESRRAITARRAIDEKQDTIAWFGDEASGLQGFINHPNISEYILANNAAGTSKAWADKTDDEKLADVIGIITAAPLATNGKETPDTLILPMSLYNDLAFTPYGTNKDHTLLWFIQTHYTMITKIDWVEELKGAGANGTNRIMAYTRDPMKLTLEIPQPFEQFPPQQEGLEYKIICHQRTAGVIVYYPASVYMADGA